MAPTALGPAAQAAHTAFWSGSVAGRNLSAELIQKPLAQYFTDRGEALADLPVDVDVNDVDAWREEWADIAKSAGISDVVDARRLVGWLEKRSSGPAAGRATGAAGKALETLDAHGVTLSSAIISDLEKALAVGEAGDAAAQCTCCLTVALLYTGAPYSPDDVEQWQRLKSALPSGSKGTINVKLFESYTKMHHKGNHISLERALRSQKYFDAWFAQTLELLSSHGLPKAVIMLTSIVHHARQQSPHSVKRQLLYLWGYFFTEYLGLGMPEVVGVRSALVALSPDAKEIDLGLPTSSNPLDMALAAGSASFGAMSLGGMIPPSLEADSFGAAGSVSGAGSSVSSSGLSSASTQMLASAVVQQLRSEGVLGMAGPSPPEPAGPGPMKCFFCGGDCRWMKLGCCQDAHEAKEALAHKRNLVKKSAIERQREQAAAAAAAKLAAAKGD